MVHRTQASWQHLSFCRFDDDHILNANTKGAVLIIPRLCVSGCEGVRVCVCVWGGWGDLNVLHMK